MRTETIKAMVTMKEKKGILRLAKKEKVTVAEYIRAMLDLE